VERLIWAITAAGLLATSSVITTETLDTFRFSKQLAATAEAIVLAAVVVIAAIYGQFEWPPRWRRDPATAIPLAIVVWTAITALTAQQHVLSGRTLVWVATCAVIFVVIYLTATRRSFGAIYLAIAAAAANAVFALLQETRVWNPLLPSKLDLPRHLYTSGFIGNPDDLASFLVAPALCAAALLLSGRRRLWGAVGAITIAAGLAAAQSMAALAATAAGVIVMAAMRSKRSLAVAAAVLVIAGASTVAVFGNIREKVSAVPSLIRQIRHGADPVLAFENLSSNRLIPSLAAWEMFVRHPLVGVGPGCYTSEFLFGAICAELKHPSLRNSGTAYFHFGEAHNDHLQTLAVSGFPGYLLFLGAAAALTLRTRRRVADDDERAAFARLCGPAVAVAFLVLSLFQFPLALAAPMGMFLFVAAHLMGWSGNAAIA
jgi:hypothetical protein